MNIPGICGTLRARRPAPSATTSTVTLAITVPSEPSSNSPDSAATPISTCCATLVPKKAMRTRPVIIEPTMAPTVLAA